MENHFPPTINTLGLNLNIISIRQSIMSIIPFVLVVLGVLTIPTAFGSLNEDMIDMYERADRFNEKMVTFIDECYERIELPIAEQQECTSVISKYNTQVQDLESTHGNIINKMVPPIQEDEEEEEDENDVPNEATTEQDPSIGDIPIEPGHTIIPGGDVDQTFDNDVMSGGESPVASHDSSNNNNNQQNEGEDSGNQNEGEGEGD